MESPVLELKNVSRIFGDQSVVSDVSLTLHEGEVACLLGPSGCGKSTTLRIAAGVERQDRGEVWIQGQKISCQDTHLPAEYRGIGLMFQDFGLFPHMTVGQNIGFGLKYEADKQDRIKTLLEQVDLMGWSDRYPHQLSGGEQQRVALARALAPRPSVLLMDEPFSGLDDRLRDTVRDRTLDLLRAENTAVLLVTHEPEEAMRLADKIALMRRGQIVQEGAPYNIYNTPVDREAASFFSDLNVVSGRVKGALTSTPFGDFLTPGYAEGTYVEIVFRPQHLKIDFDRSGKGPNPTTQEGTPTRATVKRARFLGDHSLVEFVTSQDKIALSASVPGVFLPKPDTVLWLSVRRDRCHVFPVSGK